MDWELVKPWVNRMGIVLEFLSFWLAAPEVLGEERLRALERRIEQGLKKLQLGMVWVWLMGIIAPLVLLAAAPLRLWNRIRGYDKRGPWWRRFGLSDENHELEAIVVAAFVGLLLLVCLALSFAILTLAGAAGWLAMNWRSTLKWTLAVSVLVLTIAIGGWLLMLLIERVVEPWLRVLADDKRIRQRSLAVGAVLFVVGGLVAAHRHGLGWGSEKKKGCEMSFELQLVLLGGIIGIVGAIIGGVVEALTEDWRARRRETERERQQWIQKALNWADTGRKESLRGADLRGTNLRGVDLGPGEGREDGGADLNYADLSKANLQNAILRRAHLEGANLQGASLRNADLILADLSGANLQGANLCNANLRGANLERTWLRMARANKYTTWPKRFGVPDEVVTEDQE